jgi:HD superfamily phosphohydrolase
MARKLRQIPELLSEIGLKEADNRLRQKNVEIARLKSFESEVHALRPEKLRAFLDANQALWTQHYSPPRAEAIHIDDPIYRHLLVQEELATIFCHPIVQRLAHIKQLSFSYLIFPAATHSRLSHSLGACRNAEQALTRIFQKGRVYTAEGVRDIDLSDGDKKRLIVRAKVAALLHDLGHGPFGHGLDQYVTAKINEPSPDKFYAVDYVAKYLGETIESCGIKIEEILRILDSEQRSDLDGYDALISNLIDSPLDVDRMDYLVRDAHMTGLSIGTVNIDALIEHIVPFKGPMKVGDEIREQVILAFEPAAISYITHLLYARDSMYLNCYEHPRKLVAERMLTKAVDEFSQKNPSVSVPDLVLLTDEQLLRMLIEFSDAGDIPNNYAEALLRNMPFKEVFSICPRKYAAYIEKKTKAAEANYNDDTSQEDEEVPPKPASRIANWEEDSLEYYDRNLTTPAQWESKIAKDAELGEQSWKILVTVPSPGMLEPKFDAIRILYQTESGYGYKKLDKITGYWEGVLKHLAVERYSIKVFASWDLSSEKIDKVRRAAEALLTEA